MSLMTRIFNRGGTRVAAVSSKPEERPSRYVRRWTARKKLADLNDINRERACADLRKLYQNNPMAGRIIDMRTSYVLGEGATYSSPDENIQAVFDRFTGDRHNRFERRLREWLTETQLTGEVFPSLGVNKATGHVRIGTIVSEAVEDLLYAGAERDTPTHVLIRQGWLKVAKPDQRGRIAEGDADRAERTLPAVREEEATEKAEAGKAHPGLLQGQILHFARGKTAGMTRGVSDLLRIANLVDAYERMLWDVVDRADYQNRFFMITELGGLTQDEIDERQAKGDRMPEPGTVLYTNEKTKVTPWSPQFTGDGLRDLVDIIITVIAIGAGLPPHWLGKQDDPNRASSENIASPALKALSDFQEEVRDWLTELGQYVIDQAIRKGELGKEADRTDWSVELPQIQTADLQVLAAAISSVANGLVGMVSEEVHGLDTARRVVSLIYRRLGVDVTTEQMEEEAKALAEQREGDLAIPVVGQQNQADPAETETDAE